jgi:hypothetical protein
MTITKCDRCGQKILTSAEYYIHVAVTSYNVESPEDQTGAPVVFDFHLCKVCQADTEAEEAVHRLSYAP